MSSLIKIENIKTEYNRAKIKLILKYVKQSKNLKRTNINPNTFISINDFLAEEISLGPNADPGEINYQYTSSNNIFLYVNQLIKNINYDKIICNLNNIYIRYHHSLLDGGYFCLKNSIIYNKSIDELIIPLNLKDEINICLNNKRFIYIDLNIFYESNQIGHANLLIIDNLKKTIERFEPQNKLITISDKIYNNSFDKKFSKKTLENINLYDYKYISPIDYIPDIGIQEKADAYEGMCATFCIIYLQLRLMNPDIDRKLIIKYLLSKSKEEIINIILRYAKYIEENLKKNSSEVKAQLNLRYDNCIKQNNYIVIDFNNNIGYRTW